MDRKDNAAALAKGNDLAARLHPGPLLGNCRFATGDVYPGLRQKDRNLQRKNAVTIQILVQTIVVILAVAKQQWCAPTLRGFLALRQKLVMTGRVLRVNAHLRFPPIGKRCEAGIERRTPVRDDSWQRIREILVLPSSEAMPAHDDTTSKYAILVVKRSKLATLFHRE